MDRFPELYTSRLHLRKLQVEDVPLLVRHAHNRKISDQVKNIPYPYQEPDAVLRIAYVAQGFKSRSRYVFAIIHKGSGELIGEIGLHLDGDGRLAQVGYWIGEDHWGRGFATEALKAVLAFGFGKLGLERIFATCHTGNEASARVAGRAGMKATETNGHVCPYIARQGEWLNIP